MKKNSKLIAIILLVILVIMQFIRPDKNEGGYDSVAFFEKETQPTAQLKRILKENCYDCHSNQTEYPWYSEIAPVSYWIAHHVDEGKEHFNVSDWEQYNAKKKDHKLEEFVEEVEEGEMPLTSYTLMHGSLNEEDQKILLDWVKNLRAKYATK